MVLAALLLPAGAARALDETAATRALFAGTEDGGRGESMACSAVAPWGPEADGLSVVVVPDGQALRIALMHEEGGGAPGIVAGPATVEAIAIDPFWSCLLDVDRLAPLRGRPVRGRRRGIPETKRGG